MVVDVLTSDECTCCTSVGAGGTPLLPELDPKTGIIVRSKPNILKGNIINAFIEGGKQIYELDDFTLVKPITVFGTDSPVMEIGNTRASVLFSGSYAIGSYPIATKVLSPAEGGVESASPFSFTKTNVKRTTPGIGQSHTLTITDNQGNASIVTTGVIFEHAFYQGFSGLSIIDQTILKAMTKTLQPTGFLDGYGGANNYVVPGAVQAYIYFAGPIGTPIINGATLNGLPLPLIDHANLAVTNIYDGTVITNYWVKRTAVKFDPGTYSIILG